MGGTEWAILVVLAAAALSAAAVDKVVVDVAVAAVVVVWAVDAAGFAYPGFVSCEVLM